MPRAHAHFVDNTKPVGTGLPAKATSLPAHVARPPSLASQLLQNRCACHHFSDGTCPVRILIFRTTPTPCTPSFCGRHQPRRSRLAGEGVLIAGARRTAAFAGKPAPTKSPCMPLFFGRHMPRAHAHFVDNTKPVGAGLPAKAAAHTHPDPNFYDVQSSTP